MTTVRRRVRFNLRTLLLGAVALGAVCGGLGRLYVARLPSPPRATENGQSVEFDSQLDSLNDRFTFVMAESSRIVLAKIDGTVERVIFDLRAHTGLTGGKIFGDVKLSPSRSHLLVPCLCGDWEPASNRRLLIVELSSGNAIEAQIPVGKFEFDMGAGNDSLCYWTDDDSIAVSLTYYPPEAAHEFEKQFLLYDLANLNSPSALDLGVTRPCWFRFPDQFTAMYLADDEPVNEWRVRIYANGKSRLATKKEAADYRNLAVKENTKDPVPVTVTQVVAGTSDIHIAGKWVRRSEGVIERHPQWDEELGLFVWEEYGESSFKSLYFDLDGHYRSMYSGRYVGKIPRSEREAAADP